MRAEDECFEPWTAVGALRCALADRSPPRRVSLDNVPMHKDATLVGLVLPDEARRFI